MSMNNNVLETPQISELKTQNLTIMFTDMKGFTSRTSQQSREEIERLLYLHDEIMRPVFTEFGGTVVKTIGDAFLVTFESPTNAVLCGVKIQKEIATALKQMPQSDHFTVRVAINSGEVHLREDDIFGEAVNIAARIEGLAEGGEVWLTEAVYLSMNKNEVEISELGTFDLKGIPYPVKAYKVGKARKIHNKEVAEKAKPHEVIVSTVERVQKQPHQPVQPVQQVVYVPHPHPVPGTRVVRIPVAPKKFTIQDLFITMILGFIAFCVFMFGLNLTNPELYDSIMFEIVEPVVSYLAWVFEVLIKAMSGVYSS